MIARPLTAGTVSLTAPAVDTWGDPFALFDEPPPTPKGMRRRAPVGRCAGCRTEMIAGPGCELPPLCTGCEHDSTVQSDR